MKGTMLVGPIDLDGALAGNLYVLRSRIEGNNGRVAFSDVLHVMSKSAGGQIYGYIKPDGAEAWSVWLPAYAGEWPELDQAVSHLVGEVVIGLGGQTFGVVPQNETNKEKRRQPYLPLLGEARRDVEPPMITRPAQPPAVAPDAGETRS